MVQQPDGARLGLPDPQLAERLVFYLRSLTGDLHLAEDLYHDLLVRNLSLPKTGIEDHAAYYFRAARNLAFNALQSRKRAGEVQEQWKDWRVAVQSSSSRPEDVLEFQELTQALQVLSTEDRELVLLRVHGELSFSEIAIALELPKSTVAERYSKVLLKLKISLEAADADRMKPLKGALIS